MPYPTKGNGLSPAQEDTITSLQGLSVGQIPSATGAGEFDYSGATKSPSDEWTFDETATFPSGSIRISDPLKISESTTVLSVVDEVLGQRFVWPISVINDHGSMKLLMDEAATLVTRIPQGIDTEVITTNPIILPALASFDNETDTIVLRADVPMSNVRLRIVDVLSGLTTKYLPNEKAVKDGFGGFEFRAGENTINMDDDTPSDPINGIFNVGDTPLRSIAGRLGTITIEADNMALKGFAGVPYIENQLHALYPGVVPMVRDITDVTDNYTRLNTEYVNALASDGGFVLTHKGTTTSDTVTEGQFTTGVDGVNNPSVITDGVETFAQNDIVRTNFTKFQNGYFEVESHIGNTLTFKGAGLVGKVEGFTRDNFIEDIDTATITKVEVAVIRVNTSGRFEQGLGSTTPILYSAFSTVGDSVTIHSDVSSAGSGEIITDAERNKLAGIEALAEVNNISDSDAAELTGGGDTELHKHPFNFGAGYFSTQVDTTITVALTYYKVNAIFTPTTETNVEWDAGNLRWVYTGNGVGSSLSILLSFTAGQNENGKKDISYRVLINGGLVSNPYPNKDLGVDKSLPTSVTMLIADVHLTNGDYIELYATHENNGKKVETSNCSIMIR